MFVANVVAKHRACSLWVPLLIVSAVLLPVTITAAVFAFMYYGVEYMLIVSVVSIVISVFSLVALLFTSINSQISALQETDRQKDELLSIVSHQLATPISSMQYLLELFQDGDFGRLTKKQAEQMIKLQASVRNASELVRMILDVTRIQMGKLTVHPTIVNLEQFVDGLLDVVQPKIQEKKIKFITTITRPMTTAELDEYLLRMTLLNIISNAIKYTPNSGTIWFEASVRKDYFYCKVTDTGPGVPENEQSLLYQKLYRASNVRDTVPGTGFGLYVAKGAIEAMGGIIQFHSKLHKGTSFYVQVPLVKVSHKKRLSSRKPIAYKYGSSKNKKPTKQIR